MMKNSDMRTFVKCFVVMIVILTLSLLDELYGSESIISSLFLVIPFLGAAFRSANDPFKILFVLFLILEAAIISLLITGINRFLKKPGSK